MQKKTFTLQRTALSVAVLALLASGSANATSVAPAHATSPVVGSGYSWTTPDSTFDTQNGYTTPTAQSSFTGINDSGTITGTFLYKSADTSISGLSNNAVYGFVGTSKAVDNIATNTTWGYAPGQNNSLYGTNAVTGINNAGYAIISDARTAQPNNQQVGSYLSGQNGNFTNKTAISDSNSLTSIGGGGIVDTYALGIDNSLIVGANNISGNANGYSNDGFVYNISAHTYTDYVFGGTISGTLDTTVFTGVQYDTTNSNTFITGYYTDTAGTHGLIFDQTTGVWTTVNDANATGGTFVQGLNSKGEAVGYYVDNTGNHGFTYNYETKTFINANISNPLDTSKGTVILGINDAGTIVGFVSSSGSNSVGFEATLVNTPVPEPEQVSMLMLGLLPVLGFSRRLKKQAVNA